MLRVKEKGEVGQVGAGSHQVDHARSRQRTQHQLKTVLPDQRSQAEAEQRLDAHHHPVVESNQFLLFSLSYEALQVAELGFVEAMGDEGDGRLEILHHRPHMFKHPQFKVERVSDWFFEMAGGRPC